MTPKSNILKVGMRVKVISIDGSTGKDVGYRTPKLGWYGIIQYDPEKSFTPTFDLITVKFSDGDSVSFRDYHLQPANKLLNLKRMMGISEKQL